MAFGDFATLLSSFTGADENPLSEGGNWAKLNSSDSGDIKRVSNAVGATSIGTGSRYWTPATFGPDVEAYYTISTKPNNLRHASISLRIQDAGGAGTWDGYNLFFSAQSGTDTWGIEKFTNGTGSTLTSGTREFSSGEKIGFSAVGTTLSAYVFTGGAWTLLGTFTDATYGAAGAVALRMSDATVRGDDFFAGNIASLEKAGNATAGLVGAGADVSVAVETGYAVVGLVGSGVKQFTGSNLYTKTGRAIVGTVGAGVGERITASATYTKAGHAIVGTTTIGPSGHFTNVIPYGISIAFGSNTLDPYPAWTRIDQ